MKSIRLIFQGILILFLTRAVSGDIVSAQEIHFQFVRPEQTDTAIRIMKTESHYCVRPAANKPAIPRLMILFPGTGGKARNFLRFSDLAAQMGYHVITLSYPNAESARKYCQNSSDTACYGNFRREIIYGENHLEEINIPESESILSRLFRLLDYLEIKDPEGDWKYFLHENNTVWNNITLAGHSQGAGHAAFMAQEFKVSRVLLFAGPNDFHSKISAPAGWLYRPSLTPVSDWYVFLHAYDSSIPISEQMSQIRTAGISAEPYIFSPEAEIPEGVRLLHSRLDQGSPYTHISLVTDSYTPVDGRLKPLYEPAWRWMLTVRKP